MNNERKKTKHKTEMLDTNHASRQTIHTNTHTEQRMFEAVGQIERPQKVRSIFNSQSINRL